MKSQDMSMMIWSVLIGKFSSKFSSIWDNQVFSIVNKQKLKKILMQFNTNPTLNHKNIHKLRKMSKLDQWIPHHQATSQVNQIRIILRDE